MHPIITLIGVFIALYVLLECINIYTIGGSMTRNMMRIVRQMFNRSTVIDIPEDLQIAAANGLLRTGSEVIVGDESQWNGSTVIRFAVSPSMVRERSGTIMRIIRLTSKSIELKALSDDTHAHTTKN